MRRLLAVAAASLALLLSSTLPAEAANVVGPGYYNGYRWYGTTVCVEDRTPAKSYGLRAVVYNAVADWNMNTNLKVWYKRPAAGSTCDGYSQRIVVTQGAYARNGLSGWYVRAGLVWGKTPAGNFTYLQQSPGQILLNTTYSNSLAGWDHVMTHELGHGFGLSHVTSTCVSVMAQGCPWWTKTSSNDRAWTNAIYAQ